MGNENSRLKGLVIDKNAVEANDFWVLHNAELPTTSTTNHLVEDRQLLSVFQGEHVVVGKLWVARAPMERAIKNLMIYRHPYILKYVSTWVQGGQKHLATERVRPLTAVLATQSDIQICLGLRTILSSLIFLIEKAMARHLNICASSIYITDDGSWRLAGFEYVWKCKDVTKDLLDLANAYRYKTAIDPDEMREHNIDFIEQYAFATLCEEILSKCNKQDVATPHAQEFRLYCVNHLKHKNPLMRPKLSAVLLHPYFNHEFALIHSFLFELPLKNVQEKQDFFTGLIDRLRYFNEEVVGVQLAADLLSRMVLLDPTAQLCVTPYVLKTKTDLSAALFSNQTYLRHLMPHIKKMFRLRDAQIRLILLEYFMEFVRLLSEEEIQEHILPHLLAGMNDTNDVLVAKTLRCLADLVPILGAATVIGGQRTRLFSDGRPQAAVSDTVTMGRTQWVEPRSITPVMGREVDYMVSGSPLPETIDLSGSFNSLTQDETTNDEIVMALRLSPDGGEDDKSAIITDGDVENNKNNNNDDDDVDNDDDDDNDDNNNDNDNEKDDVISKTRKPTLTTTKKTKKTTKLPTIKATTDKTSTQMLNNVRDIVFDDDEAWSDWEIDELQRLNDTQPTNRCDETKINAINVAECNNVKLPFINNNNNSNNDNNNTQTNDAATKQQQLNTLKSKKSINDDIDALDIQVQKSATLNGGQTTNEFDFFKDMEPIIDIKRNKNPLLTNANTNLGASPTTTKTTTIVEEIFIDSSRFAANGDATAINFDEGDGWGVDDNVVVDDDDYDDDDNINVNNFNVTADVVALNTRV